MKGIYNLHNWIDALPGHIQTLVLSKTQTRRYCDGEVIYNLGDTPTGLYQIAKGQARVCNYTYKGKELQMATLYVGDCFGEMGLIDNLPRVNNIYAMGETLLNVLAKESFLALYREHKEIAQQLNLYFCYRMRTLHSMVEDASVLTLRERILRLLTRLGYSRGERVDDEVVISGVSHEVIANLLGTTRQGVSRELKELEKSQMIQLRYSKIVIPDIECMTEYYEQLVGAELLVPTYKGISEG
jgi:CRP-like cAMP-binding protein